MTTSAWRDSAVSNLTSSDNNIYIGGPGEANESNTIRIAMTIRISDASLVATFLAGSCRPQPRSHAAGDLKHEQRAC